MTKKYLLDTSVIVSDPHCLQNFPNAYLILQEGVLVELDKIKTNPGESGKNARVFIRKLDELSKDSNILKGIILSNNSIIKIDVHQYDVNNFGDPTYVDNKILACAQQYKGATIVSRDIALRLKARAFGINAVDYQNHTLTVNDIYPGFIQMDNKLLGDKLKKQEYLECTESELLQELLPNECVEFVNKDKRLSLGRKIDDRIYLVPGDRPWGLSARSTEQAFAIDLLLDPEVPLVTLAGRAGSGKTLLAVAAGLQSVINDKQYDRLIVYRPIQPVGTDLGYLPGELADKLEPWMGAIKDSMEFLSSSYKKRKKNNNNNKDSWKEPFAQFMDRINLEALTHIRGRSIPNAFIIMDECFPYDQNVKTESGKEKIGKIYKKFKAGKKIKVKTFNEEKKCFEYKLVTNAWDRGLKSLIQLKMGNRKIKCTPNHKFLTENGWKSASDIELGELILTSEPDKHQLGFTVLDSKIYLPKQERVYDIEVEDNHNFILCSSAKGGQGLGGPIVHNCQNIPKSDIKTLLTRVGEGTKIVLTGDIEQIDNNHLDAINNGLVGTIDSFKESSLAGHITLNKGERSPLATSAAEIL